MATPTSCNRWGSRQWTDGKQDNLGCPDPVGLTGLANAFG